MSKDKAELYRVMTRSRELLRVRSSKVIAPSAVTPVTRHECRVLLRCYQARVPNGTRYTTPMITIIGVVS